MGSTKKKALGQKKKQGKGRKKQIVWLLVAACLVATGVLILVAVAPWKKKTSQTEQSVSSQFVPPPFDETAVVGVPEVSEDLGWTELPLREGYTITLCGVLQASADGTLPIWLYSAPDNQVWVKVRVIDADGNRLGETGLLRPGEYVESVQLSTEATSGPVTLHIMGYEPDTYYSAGSVDFETTLNMDTEG